jgi:hypothetical protein
MPTSSVLVVVPWKMPTILVEVVAVGASSGSQWRIVILLVLDEATVEEAGWVVA